MSDRLCYVKRWPIIRHIRGIAAMTSYMWKAITIWNIHTYEDLLASGMYMAERKRAMRIMDGEE